MNIVLNYMANIQKAANRIKQTWTKLSDRDIAYYLEGNRPQFICVLQNKYFMTKEQAEDAVSNIERQSSNTSPA
jgi:uncharacterized protein YjbJ (UPF0337 family)